jgi:signal transduction histidine kinase
MRSWFRGQRGGLATFAVIAALVAGGLGWVTRAALRLEREQGEARAQADQDNKLRTLQRLHDQKLRLALWRLDSRIAPLLAREDARPYNHYSALYTPPIVLDSTGQRKEPPTVLEPSPLLNCDVPDWMLLHFQTAESTWGSPQVPSKSNTRQLVRNGISVTNATPQRAHLLAELSDPALAQKLVGCVQNEDLRLMNPGDAPANPEGPGEPVPPPPPATNKDLARSNPRQLPDFGYASRVQQRNVTGQETRQQAFSDDNAYAAMQNTANWKEIRLMAKARQDTTEQVLVSLSPMVPLWLTVDGSERLLVARLVRIVPKLSETFALLLALPKPGLPVNLAAVALSQWTSPTLSSPKEVCQGIILDWPRLQALLADEVRDLFPEARFVPLRQQVPPHPERTMTALPVELEPGTGLELESVLDPDSAPSPPAPLALGWTPLRIGLALSWAAALVGLLAVGLSGWSLIDLSERRIRFISAVTHELRTPLTTLRLYLDMLTGGMVKEEQRKAEYLHTLNAETERLNRLVSNVLDFSRLENQRPRLERSTVLLADLLEQVRAAWQMRCHDSEKELVVDNAAGPEVKLVTDVQLVQQILGNLIDNACKYSRGAEDRHIWLRARSAPGDRWLLEVEDRGPGVALKERASIFRPFRRGRGAETTAGGVGLGLALAQRWAGLLGGKLSLHGGRDGSGACFLLELPSHPQ